jgi:hypothetical protein
VLAFLLAGPGGAGEWEQGEDYPVLSDLGAGEEVDFPDDDDDDDDDDYSVPAGGGGCDSGAAFGLAFLALGLVTAAKRKK